MNIFDSLGSSPLARGLLGDTHEHLRLSGIIPARAGFTCTRHRPGRSPQDHPRSRGVYALVHRSMEFSRGSSPLARGLQLCTLCRSHDERIIPARAGFTTSTRRASLRMRDHPRSRGVYALAPSAFSSAGGSSPLARSLPDEQPLIVRRRRIIPARAGFTRVIVGKTCAFWDHPRSRGVYAIRQGASEREAGSSPLARGLL